MALVLELFPMAASAVYSDPHISHFAHAFAIGVYAPTYVHYTIYPKVFVSNVRKDEGLFVPRDARGMHDKRSSLAAIARPMMVRKLGMIVLPSLRATLAWTIRSGNVIAIPESGLAAHVKENAVALSLTRTHTGSKCGEIGKSAKNGKKEYEAAKKAQDEVGEKVAGGMRDAIARHTRNQRHREACSPVRWEREVDLDRVAKVFDRFV